MLQYPVDDFGDEKDRIVFRPEDDRYFLADLYIYRLIILFPYRSIGGERCLYRRLLRGAILGLGVTCIFRAQSTSAGTDVLARVIANDSNLKVSNMIIVLDSAVVLLGLIVFKDWAVPLYSWFTIFVYGKIVEMFQTENPNRAVFIVSRKTKEMRDLIVDKMGMRGTFIHGKGMYEGHETEIIFTIAERKDMPRLKDEVKEIDPNAFVSTMHASKDSPRPGI